ncbi:MAG: formylglycine-generating enzyme family protein, partial [Gammaproteobacteria bacterium]|nr:formylglycine-generating enzyme family protein [Gammaproteobacteria bacterium]
MAVSLPMTLLVRILCLAIFAGLLPMRVSAASPITIRDCADCPELVVVPRGRFMMGSDDGEVGRSEGPIHEVAIRAFALARTEVTVADFRKFVAATGYQVASGCRVQASTIVKGERVGWEERSDAGWQAPGFIAPLTEDMPVVCVGHGDARAYAAWLSRVSGKAYRLPSEAEWEYAARAGSRGIY